MDDCDFIVLEGKRKEWVKEVKGEHVDTCCCDTCITGVAQCLGATCCCLACIDKKPG